MKQCPTALVILVFLVSVASATSELPSPRFSSATSAPGSVLIVPDGSGPSLAAQGIVVEVNVRDSDNYPIAGYPFQDVVVNAASGVQLCVGGSVADGNTNAGGQTTVSGLLAGGGWTEQDVFVYLAGTPLSSSPLSLRINSPDLSGDRIVNMVDLGIFAADIAAEPSYDFRSDLNHDGVEDLVDVGLFAGYFATGCP